MQAGHLPPNEKGGSMGWNGQLAPPTNRSNRTPHRITFAFVGRKHGKSMTLRWRVRDLRSLWCSNFLSYLDWDCEDFHKHLPSRCIRKAPFFWSLYKSESHALRRGWPGCCFATIPRTSARMNVPTEPCGRPKQPNLEIAQVNQHKQCRLHSRHAATLIDEKVCPLPQHSAPKANPNVCKWDSKPVLQ